MTKPLAGIRVLELARILAGPWCGQLLADLGADVVKVERPGVGDDTRTWGPPFVEAADGGQLSAGYFHATNRGKRSLEVEIDTPKGQSTVRRLAQHADILIENFKVGGLKKYGLDYPTLSALNPRLIYCSVTGFGQSGPYAHRGGYDFMVQGMSGVMSLTGEPDGEPLKTAVAYADVFTGLYASSAVLAALHGRHATGRGLPHRHGPPRHPDLGDRQPGHGLHADRGSAAPHRQRAHVHRALPGVPRRGRPHHRGLRQRRSVPAAVPGSRHVLGRTTRPMPRTPRAWRGRDVLVPLIAAETIKWPKARLLAAFERETMPAGPINSLPEVFADPQVVHRAMVSDLDEPAARGGAVPDPAKPDRRRRRTDGRPARRARVGQDNDAVLRDPAWGYGADG